MTLDEIWSRAREIMKPNCRACKVCNGVACRGEIPGVGAMGDGSSWTNCVEFLSRIKLNMDTVYESRGQDTSMEIFGHRFNSPVFAAPIGGMSHNYNGAMTDRDWTFALVRGARAAGILPFTGDNGNNAQYECGLEAAKENDGLNVITLKPWSDNEKLIRRAKEMEDAGCIAFACDVDAAGFENMGRSISQIGPKSEAELRELTSSVKIPFLLKGVMTAKGAEKAARAGCAGVIVSTHGGRVIQSAPGTCEVIPEIKAAVGDSINVIADGALRTWTDIFKALALGADAVMIGRPFVVAAHGGGAEGVTLYAESLAAQLRNVMLMTGAATLEDITRDKIRL